MGLFRKKRKETVVGLYGKHPSADDFLRLNAGSDAVQWLDEWLSSSLAAASRLIPDWEAVYYASPVVFFLTNPALNRSANSERILIGAFAPSRDRIGRQYPLIIFAELSAAQLENNFAIVPFSHFLQTVERIMDRRQSFGREGLIQTVQKLAPPDEQSFLHAHKAYKAYLANAPCETEFSQMFGPHQVTQGVSATQLIREMGRSLVKARSLPNYGLRCPLKGNVMGQAGFWLGLLQHHAGKGPIPSTLWSGITQLIYLGRISAKALTGLWWPNWQDDSLYDLANIPPPKEGQPTIAGEYLSDLFR